MPWAQRGTNTTLRNRRRRAWCLQAFAGAGKAGSGVLQGLLPQYRDRYRPGRRHLERFAVAGLGVEHEGQVHKALHKGHGPYVLCVPGVEMP